MKDLNSSVISATTTVGGKPFQSAIVQGKIEYFRASVYDVYCEYDDLGGLNPGAWFKYFDLSRSTVPVWILPKSAREICFKAGVINQKSVNQRLNNRKTIIYLYI